MSNAEDPNPQNPPESALRQVIRQRNQAMACAILSITISLAAVTNNFLVRRSGLVAANNQILVLQKALRQTETALGETVEALRRNQEILMKLTAAPGQPPAK